MAEWTFKRDTAFRKQFFVPDSFAHPAKMDAQLLIKIVGDYTEIGDVILDPMAGSGTTMLACMMGRNCILIELEEKFCKMCRDNWEIVRMHPQLGYEMGSCQIIQGDARNLEGLLADKIITSPPYSDSPTGGGLNIKPPREGHNDQSGRGPDSPSQRPYADKIITSPPFAGQSGGLKSAESFMYGNDNVGKRMMGGIKGGTGENPKNIDHLPYGNIDSIITSPPYEGALEASSRHTKGGIPGRDKVLGQTGTYATLEDAEIIARKVSKGFQSPEAIKMIEGLPRGYAQNPDNIGNLKSTTYLEAMLQVYRQCFKVLKDGGLLILVVKNFIRQKQIVRLDIDTIKLCEQAGFSYLHRHYRKLPSQSFWRILYHKKHPEVEQILYEDVLVFKK